MGNVQFDGARTGTFSGGRFSDRKLAGRMAGDRPLAAAGVWDRRDRSGIPKYFPFSEEGPFR